MKKFLILALALLAMLSVFSFSTLSAQDEEEELPPCDPMESMTNMEGLIAPLQDLGEFTVEGEATASDYSALVAELDAYVMEYWVNLEDSEIACAEEYFVAYNLGLALDEFLLVMELSALSVHEAEAGNTEAATTFSELATSRSEMLTEDMTAFTEILPAMMTGEMDMGGDLDACSDDEITVTGEGIGTINETYIELGEALSEASGTDLSAVAAGFATLSSEYWLTFVPELPECQEVQDIATGYGLLLDETAIMVGLLRLSELETEAGNDEVATALADSATARAEALTAAAEELFATEE